MDGEKVASHGNPSPEGTGEIEDQLMQLSMEDVSVSQSLPLSRSSEER